MGPWILIAAPVVVVLLWIAMTYNGLIQMRNQCREAWAGIDTELQRRYVLIPNLVATVRGYAKHEREVLEEVTRLRQACAANRGSPGEQARAENELIHGLQRLIAAVERYPDLKADRHFRELQEELVNTEDRIQAARRFFNGNVRAINTRIDSFPSNLIASWFHFARREYFHVDDVRVRAAPSVRIDSGESPFAG